MPQRERRVWTLGRQLVGNIVPLLIAGPFLFLGIKNYPVTGLSGPTLIWLMAFPVVGWLATNLLGNSGSWGLKDRIEKELSRERRLEGLDKLFVGFARPGYSGLLDPHEDLGLLLVHADKLEFFGLTTRVELQRSDVRGVTFRSNPHSWLGLGRWVSVEGQSGGRQVRLLIEPREAKTLTGNRALGTRLHARLARWAQP